MSHPRPNIRCQNHADGDGGDWVHDEKEGDDNDEAEDKTIASSWVALDARSPLGRVKKSRDKRYNKVTRYTCYQYSMSYKMFLFGSKRSHKSSQV